MLEPEMRWVRTDGTLTVTSERSNNNGGLRFSVFLKHKGEVQCIAGKVGDRTNTISLSGSPGQQVSVTIDRFYLLPQWRGQGHGTKIMALILQMYGDQGTKTMNITTANKVGVRFYLRCGFKKDHAGNLLINLSPTNRLIPAPPVVSVSEVPFIDFSCFDDDHDKRKRLRQNSSTEDLTKDLDAELEPDLRVNVSVNDDDNDRVIDLTEDLDAELERGVNARLKKKLVPDEVVNFSVFDSDDDDDDDGDRFIEEDENIDGDSYVLSPSDDCSDKGSKMLGTPKPVYLSLQGRGRTDSKRALRDLSNQRWQVEPTTGLNGFATITDTTTGITHSVPAGRAQKAQIMLDYDDVVGCMHPTKSMCQCTRKCWDQAFTMKQVFNQRKVVAGMASDDAVGLYHVHNIQRDEGLKFMGRVVCRGFYAKVNGSSEHVVKKAVHIAKMGADAVWQRSAGKISPEQSAPEKGELAHAFWSVWFDKLCQRPNDDIRLFPADKSYDQIWTECFLPWWKQQGKPDSWKPSKKYWQKMRHHKDFDDVKRRAKHFHCRCTVCATLKTLQLCAFTSAQAMATYQQARRRHEDAIHAWRILEGKLDAEATQCPEELIFLSYDATNAISFPHFSNRPLKAFTKGGMAFTPWLITNHGLRQREYIYLPKGKWEKGANYVLTQLMAMIRRIKSDPSNPQHKARRLVMVADNASENKNVTLLAWAADIVGKKWFDSVEFLFGEVGHTHNGNDAVHKVHNQDLGRNDSVDLGHLVWNYQHPWPNLKTRPRASVLNVMYDWDSFYKPHIRRLGGFTKTAHDEFIVRGFRASRDNEGQLVSLMWKADPATDKGWRGSDGTVNGTGFYVLTDSPIGVPQMIAGATELQRKRYQDQLQTKGLKRTLAPWKIGSALEENLRIITTGIVPAEKIETTTPAGQWGLLCKIGCHEVYKALVRFIDTVLGTDAQGNSSVWDLPEEAEQATSLRFHPSKDAEALVNRPLPYIGYTHQPNGITKIPPSRRPIFNHPNNIAARAALEQQAKELEAVSEHEAADLEAVSEVEDDLSSFSDNSDESDSGKRAKEKEKTFIPSMSKCVVGQWAVILAEDKEDASTQWIEVGKITKVNSANKNFEVKLTQCTKDVKNIECLEGKWNVNPSAKHQVVEAKSVVCYCNIGKSKKLPVAAKKAIENRVLCKGFAGVVGASQS